MVSISVREAPFDQINQDTLPDSTPRKEGGGDAKGESKTVLAKEGFNKTEKKINVDQPSTTVTDPKLQDHLLENLEETSINKG